MRAGHGAGFTSLVRHEADDATALKSSGRNDQGQAAARRGLIFAPGDGPRGVSSIISSWRAANTIAKLLSGVPHRPGTPNGCGVSWLIDEFYRRAKLIISAEVTQPELVADAGFHRFRAESEPSCSRIAWSAGLRRCRREYLTQPQVSGGCMDTCSACEYLMKTM
jgi:hypothetical protein